MVRFTLMDLVALLTIVTIIAFVIVPEFSENADAVVLNDKPAKISEFPLPTPNDKNHPRDFDFAIPDYAKEPTHKILADSKTLNDN